MKLLFQSALLLAEDGEGNANRYGLGPSPDVSDGVSFWWVIIAALVIVALCWFVLSVMNKGKKTSLWKDEGSEMDSSQSVYYSLSAHGATRHAECTQYPHCAADCNRKKRPLAACTQPRAPLPPRPLASGIIHG